MGKYPSFKMGGVLKPRRLEPWRYMSAWSGVSLFVKFTRMVLDLFKSPRRRQRTFRDPHVQRDRGRDIQTQRYNCQCQPKGKTRARFESN